MPIRSDTAPSEIAGTYIMKIEIELQGTTKDLRIRWHTCQRKALNSLSKFPVEHGWIHGCDDSKSCPFTTTGSPYLTWSDIAYFACDYDCVWRKFHHRINHSVVWDDGGWLGRGKWVDRSGKTATGPGTWIPNFDTNRAK